MVAHPIDQAALAFVQALIRPELGVQVLCRRRDIAAIPPHYYSTCSVDVRGYTYCFWLSEGLEQLLIHVKGFGIFGAIYRDEWLIILTMGLDQSFSLAA